MTPVGYNGNITFKAAKALASALLFLAALMSCIGCDSTSATPTTTTGTGASATATTADTSAATATTNGSATSDPTATADNGSTGSTGLSGDLDTTFGDKGGVDTDMGSDLDSMHGMTLQADGKIVLVGESWPRPDEKPRFSLVRYNTDGSLDNTFGDGGKIISNLLGNESDRSVAYAVKQQSDGKLVIVGNAYNPGAYHPTFVTVRYNLDGKLDTTFGKKGVAFTAVYPDTGMPITDEAESLAIQPDGKILVAGYSGNIYYDFAVARLNADGSPDTAFGNKGTVMTDMGSDDRAHSVVVQPDGKILLGGYGGLSTNEWAIARYNANGSLDTTFGDGGKVFTSFLGGIDWGYNLIVLPDNKILMGGYAEVSQSPCGTGICEHYGFAVAQYNPDGSLDTSFGVSGKNAFNSISTAQAYAMARRDDGEIVLVGADNNTDFRIVVLKPDGTPDTSYSTSGSSTLDFGGQDRAYGVALDAQGRIIVGGQIVPEANSSNYDFGVVRVLWNK